jgi:hypothetical protein
MAPTSRVQARAAARRALALCAALLACATTGCASRPATGAAGSTPSEQPGTIRAVNAELGWYAIVPDSDPGTRYAPSAALPAELRQDGLRVVFSGRVGAAGDAGRRWGIPLEITSIRPAP